MQSSSIDENRNSILRHTVNDVLISLGPSIHETIIWHMNNRGVFLGQGSFNIDSLFENLQELMGPYAEEILDLTWARLPKYFGSSESPQLKSLRTLEKIKFWLGKGAK